jgi:hypothetical protein
MNPTELRPQAALDAAAHQIKTTAASVADRVSDLMGTMSLSATRIAERDLMLQAQFELRRNMAVFQLRFKESLRDSIAKETAPREDGRRRLEATDWHSLTLVEDHEVEQGMQSDRIGQMITQECEAEQRELAAYIGDLLRTGRADEERNPLRPKVIGAALYHAIEAVTREADTRKLMARELGQALAKAMKPCYAEIVRDLQGRGVKPVGLSVRTGEGPGYQLPGVNSAYDSLPHAEYLSTRGQQGLYDPTEVGAPGSYAGQGGPGGDYTGTGGYGGGGGAGGGGAGGGGGGGMRSGAGGFVSSGGFAGGGLSGQGGGHSGGYGGGGSGSSGGAGGGYYRGPGLAGIPPHTGSGSNSARGPLGPRSGGTFSRDEMGARVAAASAQADAQLMNLLRRLTVLASRPGELDALPGTAVGGGHPVTEGQSGMSRPGSLGRAGLPGGAAGGSSGAGPGSSAGSVGNAPYGDGLTGMMAVNLIRAHREELKQASSGKLDHMVIDVVGSLFDQILSDPRVPPQMARQIARLQLPVLRVAMNDATFFSSRRHPVRRFVNRIASLACAFDEFDDGPGKAFLARVRELVQEIVEGDFDQIELYGAKLGELEAFISDQTQDAVQQTPAAATLEGKESELRIQQRYMLQLAAALKPMQLPEYLRDFLAQVWSQAVVLAVRRDGPTSERFARFKRVGRDVVMSVQPKGSPVLRKRFLMQLPQLMKDLNEGMALIGWPEAAQKAFFAQLLPAHAESLKAAPLSELDHNMMAKALEGVFNTAVPGIDSLSLADLVPEVESEVIERRFSPEEAKQVGLVEESAVDWSGEVDIPLEADGSPDSQAGDTTPGDLGLDINLDLSTSEPAEPSRGPQLMDHIKLGFAYQMHLKDEWQKVRLTYVSPGRSFFVFSRGKKHQETISMTARMLARMCETGRMKAFENAYLMERATQRARKQLAALKAQTTH